MTLPSNLAHLESKKITLATFKSFIRNNYANLHIKVESDFDPMQDMVIDSDDPYFNYREETIRNVNNTLGIKGLWLVGHSDDYFTYYNKNGFVGIEVYNCCGTSILAVRVK